MDLETNIDNLVTAFVTDIRDISNSLGGASNIKNAGIQSALNTTAKNFAGAINELKVAIDASSGAAVTSVNGSSGPGAVTINTDAIAEGSTNQYFTEARVLASLITGYAASAGVVAPTDSVLTAIGKLQGNISAIDLTDLIDDAAAATTTTYSGTKIDAQITAAIAAALEGEDLSDLAAAVAALAAADNSLLNFGAAQTLTAGQKTQGQQNLGLGDLETADFAADYIASRDA